MARAARSSDRPVMGLSHELLSGHFDQLVVPVGPAHLVDRSGQGHPKSQVFSESDQVGGTYQLPTPNILPGVWGHLRVRLWMVADQPPFLFRPDRTAPVPLLVAVDGPTSLTATEFASLREPVRTANPDATIEVVDDPRQDTLGALLWLGPPDGPTDAVDFSATVALLESAALLTVDTADVLVVEMRGEPIGWIRSGQLDDGLVQGLLEPWREQLP